MLLQALQSCSSGSCASETAAAPACCLECARRHHHQMPRAIQRARVALQRFPERGLQGSGLRHDPREQQTRMAHRPAEMPPPSNGTCMTCSIDCNFACRAAPVALVPGALPSNFSRIFLRFTSEVGPMARIPCRRAPRAPQAASLEPC